MGGPGGLPPFSFSPSAPGPQRPPFRLALRALAMTPPNPGSATIGATVSLLGLLGDQTFRRRGCYGADRYGAECGVKSRSAETAGAETSRAVFAVLQRVIMLLKATYSPLHWAAC